MPPPPNWYDAGRLGIENGYVIAPYLLPCGRTILPSRRRQEARETASSPLKNPATPRLAPRDPLQ